MHPHQRGRTSEPRIGGVALYLLTKQPRTSQYERGTRENETLRLPNTRRFGMVSNNRASGHKHVRSLMVLKQIA